MPTLWTLHGDGRTIAPGEVVRPEERLAWPRTIGIGIQHVVAMFGATFLVPLLTGFPPATTILFSGIGTLVFLLVTRNRVPSYLGSSFAFISPVIAAKAHGGIPVALGGIVVTGALFFLVGLLVQVVGSRWIDIVMPPIVTGAIVALIGLNLAPVAKNNFFGTKDPVSGKVLIAGHPFTAFVTLIAVLLVGILFKGFIGRLSIFLGVLIGWVYAAIVDGLDFSTVKAATWIGLPDLTAPHFSWRATALIAPVVIVLIAENTGHVKAVASMTERNLDDSLGAAYMGDGAATMLAGLGGGSGTTTYAENIGVMAATRVYSTAAYAVAGVTAILLGLCPKFGALILTIPPSVLGGVTTVLYGLIAILGARIWIESRVDFKDYVNLVTAAVAVIVGAADYSLTIGDVSFNGIALGSIAALVIYHVMRALGRAAGTATGTGGGPVASPSSVESADLGSDRSDALPGRNRGGRATTTTSARKGGARRR